MLKNVENTANLTHMQLCVNLKAFHSHLKLQTQISNNMKIKRI